MTLIDEYLDMIHGTGAYAVEQVDFEDAIRVRHSEDVMDNFDHVDEEPDTLAPSWEEAGVDQLTAVDTAMNMNGDTCYVTE